MDRDRFFDVERERDELTLDEFDMLEVVELPDRELMTGCGGGGGGFGLGIALSVQVNVNVGIGLGGFGGGCYNPCS
jgi:hypothetical protein